MSQQWRLILDPPARGAYNMAADLALLKSVAAEESLPVLRFYGWNPPAVTLGYFQNAEDEINAEICCREGVDIIRRITGGGAVFHEKEITYSIVFPVQHALTGSSILDSYALILRPFVETLASYGLDAAHQPVNDIIIDGRKVSGSAQTRRHGCVLQHGTILCDIDRAKAFSCLTVPLQKIADKGLTNPSQRVTSLKEHLGECAISEEFKNAFIAKTVSLFSELYFITLDQSRLSDKETDAAAEIEKEMFALPDWTNHRKTANTANRSDETNSTFNSRLPV